MRELKYRIAQSKVKQLVNGKVRFKTRQSASILLCYPDTNGQLSHYIILGKKKKEGIKKLNQKIVAVAFN